MKCPYCNKTFELNPDDVDCKIICKFCYQRFYKEFTLIDFFDENVNLFVILGVLTAIAVLLPQITNNNLIFINSWIQGSTLIQNSPLSLLIPNRELFIALSILSCWILMVLIGLGIITDLFYNRKSELIWVEIYGHTIRDGDIGRSIFLLPFLILGISLTLYILSIFWNLFQIFEIIFIIIATIFIILIVIQNKSIIRLAFKKE